MELKLAKALDRLGTESAFSVLAEAKKIKYNRHKGTFQLVSST